MCIKPKKKPQLNNASSYKFDSKWMLMNALWDALEREQTNHVKYSVLTKQENWSLCFYDVIACQRGVTL